MQKLTFAFIAVVLLIFVLTGLYIRSAEAEKKQLRSQIETQQISDLHQLPSEEESATRSAVPSKQLGAIEGSLSFPSSGIPDTMEVCAEHTKTLEITCTGEIQKSDDYTFGFGYQLELTPGSYLVYAQLPNDSYRAYYSDFVLCGLAASCPSHNPIMVTVEPNMTASGIDPQDWYDTNQ
ncbi:MAG: hypothetical protein GW946_03355 [Candidatus Pacebacteria bacterium]|nr:hypothetical protein [Candidatus Paceibacterota bacterium]